MSFSEFLQQFMSGFSEVLSHVGLYFSMLVQNNLVKLVIYISLSGIVFWLVFEVYNLLLQILGKKKNKAVKNSNIE